MNSDETAKSIIDKIKDITLDDIPDLDLYMDQVTTYLNRKFCAIKRHEDDKLMTKTMINNYAKSRLLPSPEKKKYSKDHLIVLVFIYFFKNVMSINDVTTTLKPLLDKYFGDGQNSLEDITNIFIDYIKESNLTEPLLEECSRSSHMFDGIDSDDEEYMQTLGTITALTCDVFIRKLIIEQLIDSLPVEENDKSSKDGKDDKSSKENKDNKSSKKKKKKDAEND